MKKKIKGLIKSNAVVMNAFYFAAKWGLTFTGLFIPINPKSMIFVSFSGRNYDDSPKALYEEICNRETFNDWDLTWAFKEPELHNIPRGKKIKFGTWQYWIKLLGTKVWIDNGGIDLGLDLNRKKNLLVKTWHGTFLKKGYGNENTGAILSIYRKHQKVDKRSIRCIQTEYELENCSKSLKAAPETFMKCGYPRNDVLLKYTEEQKKAIRKRIGIPSDKKVLLYMPTFRNYLVGSNHEFVLKPPIDLSKWKNKLEDEYVLLMRTHYMIAESLDLKEDGFIYNACDYQPLSDLYSVADILITDYSSAMFDYALLEKPIRCFGYDYEEYIEKSGLICDLATILPYPMAKTEDELLKSIESMDYDEDCKRTKRFREQFAEYFKGSASKEMVDEIEKRLEL